jgi:hypothetical protein
MKKNIITFLLLLSAFNSALAKENELPADFQDYCLNAESNYDFSGESEKKFTRKLVTEQYLKYDFSDALKPNSGDEGTIETSINQFLGVIGDEYQRLYIVFKEVKKDANDPRVYLVDGYTKVKGNQNNFSGKITIEEIYDTKGGDITGVDNIVVAKSKTGAIILAKYEFLEDKNQKYSGKFQGKMWLGGYINLQDKFVYGGDFGQDQRPCPMRRNNQYVGTWQSYTTSKTRIAHFGQHQIPGLVDDYTQDPTGGGTGCGGYEPDPKYNSRGWSKEEQPPKC